jgi:hypothetical protein
MKNRKKRMRKIRLLFATAMVVTGATLVAAQAQQQQQLTPYQQRVLLGVKNLLTERIEKNLHNFEPDSQLYQIERIEVLKEVLRDWTDMPDYGRYAVDVMEWQGNLSIAIANMADDYVRQHGHLDPGFDKELRNRTGTDPAFSPPAEYLNRHLCGVPDCRSLR